MGQAVVVLKKGEGRTLKAGGMWVYDNEIASVTGSYEDGDHSGICPTYFQRTTASQHLFLSLLSDSNQRPRDYKSRALAN